MVFYAQLNKWKAGEDVGSLYLFWYIFFPHLLFAHSFVSSSLSSAHLCKSIKYKHLWFNLGTTLEFPLEFISSAPSISLTSFPSIHFPVKSILHEGRNCQFYSTTNPCHLANRLRISSSQVSFRTEKPSSDDLSASLQVTMTWSLVRL